MTARVRKRPPSPVVPGGAPPPDTITSALALLSLFTSPEGVQQAQDVLSAMEAATEANVEAMEGFPAADKLAAAVEQAEADRAEAAQVLADARAEAKAIETEAAARIEAEREQLDAERQHLDDCDKAVQVATRDLAAARKAFEQETAGLRQALAR